MRCIITWIVSSADSRASILRSKLFLLRRQPFAWKKKGLIFNGILHRMCPSEAKWVYLTICTHSRYTYVPYRAYIHVPPRISHSTCMYPDVYEGVHTCTSLYTLGYMYVPPLIRQGTCMYPHLYFRIHGCTQSFAAGYLTYSITGDCPGSLFWLFPIIGDLFCCSFRAASLYDRCSVARYGSYPSLSIRLAIYYWAIV